LLTARDVAQRLRVSTATVYSLCRRGELMHHRVSNAIRVSEDALAIYLHGRQQDPLGWGRVMAVPDLFGAITGRRGQTVLITDGESRDAASSGPHQAFADGGARMSELGRVPGGGIEPPTRERRAVRPALAAEVEDEPPSKRRSPQLFQELAGGALVYLQELQLNRLTSLRRHMPLMRHGHLAAHGLRQPLPCRRPREHEAGGRRENEREDANGPILSVRFPFAEA